MCCALIVTDCDHRLLLEILEQLGVALIGRRGSAWKNTVQGSADANLYITPSVFPQRKG